MQQRTQRIGWVAVLVLVGLVGLGAAQGAAPVTGAATALKGKYSEVKEPSTHSPGKVKMLEFADFYCPHCHMFEERTVPLLEKEFGDRLEITLVGFPIIPGKLPTAFDMYEQAKVMGKGPEMRRVLFRTIHKDKVQILDRTIRAMLVKEVGLDPAAFEAGMASGKPARAVEENKKFGQRYNIEGTPTIILDGNIKADSIDPENLKLLIHSILARDATR